MSNLLRGDFSKLFKSKIFWVCIVLNLIGTVYMMKAIEVGLSPKDIDLSVYSTALEMIDSYFIYLIAFVTSFVVGSDFDGGMHRNKIMAGHSRVSIYFAGIITTYVGSLIMWAVSFVVLLLYSFSKVGARGYKDYFSVAFNTKIELLSLGYQLLAILFIVAITTAIVLLVEKKAITIIAVIILFAAFSSIGLVIDNAANTTNPTYTTIDYDKMIYVEVPNPDYIPEGPLKTFYRIVDACDVPYRMSNSVHLKTVETKEESDAFDPYSGSYMRIVWEKYYAGVIIETAVFTLLGAAVFKKHNLK